MYDPNVDRTTSRGDRRGRAAPKGPKQTREEVKTGLFSLARGTPSRVVVVVVVVGVGRIVYLTCEAAILRGGLYGALTPVGGGFQAVRRAGVSVRATATIAITITTTTVTVTVTVTAVVAVVAGAAPAAAVDTRVVA